jgi:hypothetical protein
MHGNAEGSSDVGSNNGPMWGKFFDSLNQGDDDDDARSAISGSHAAPSSSGGALRTPSRPNQMRADSSYMNPASPDIGPGDSASAVGGADDASDVGGVKKGAAAASEAAKSVLVDDGTYVFKFKTPSGRTHRFQARNDMLDNLREIVTGKLTSDPFFIFDEPLPPTTSTTATHEDDLIVSSSPPSARPDPADFTLSYTDDDGDLIHMTSDGDVVDAVKVARAQKSDRVVLYLSGGKVWEDAIKAQNAPAPSAPSAAPAVLPTPATILSPPKPNKSLPSLEEETESIPTAPSPATAVSPAPTSPTPPAATAILTPSTPPPPPPPPSPSSYPAEKSSEPDPATEPTLAPSAKVHVSPSALAAANAHVGAGGDGSIAGIPKDLLLPASIGFLGVAVLAVFALTRGSK